MFFFYGVLQCDAMCCSVLQCVATHASSGYGAVFCSGPCARISVATPSAHGVGRQICCYIRHTHNRTYTYRLSLNLSHSHTLSLNLSLAHTQTQTHMHIHSLSPFFPLSPYLSFACTHTHTHKRIHRQEHASTHGVSRQTHSYR